MKIMKKRVIAYAIDTFIIGLLLAIGRLNIQILNNNTLIAILILLLVSLKDIVFKNASIGKLILGIKIYNIDWTIPTTLTLMKRSLLTSFVGGLIYYKAKTIDGNLITVTDWERDHLKTTVIDKKVYERLKAEAVSLGGDWRQNMTELYKNYLMSLYLKQ